MAKSLVVKFGGSCLSNPQNISLAAKKIEAEVKNGKKIVVVVSALTGVTDSLLKTATEASLGRISKEELDEVLSMGERTATRLMVSALKSLGLKTVGLDPADGKFWPIYTDSKHGNAEVNLEKASEILTIIEKDLKEGVRNLQQELSRALGYYQHLQNIVNQALAKIQQARTSR